MSSLYRFSSLSTLIKDTLFLYVLLIEGHLSNVKKITVVSGVTFA